MPPNVWMTTHDAMTTMNVPARFDVTHWPINVENYLARTEKPLHRAILKNYLRHLLLEVSGYWDQILVPELTVDVPEYRVGDRGTVRVLSGKAAVEDRRAGVRPRLHGKAPTALPRPLDTSPARQVLVCPTRGCRTGTTTSAPQEGVTNDDRATHRSKRECAGAWLGDPRPSPFSPPGASVLWRDETRIPARPPDPRRAGVPLSPQTAPVAGRPPVRER